MGGHISTGISRGEGVISRSHLPCLLTTCLPSPTLPPLAPYPRQPMGVWLRQRMQEVACMLLCSYNPCFLTHLLPFPNTRSLPYPFSPRQPMGVWLQQRMQVAWAVISAQAVHKERERLRKRVAEVKTRVRQLVALVPRLLKQGGGEGVRRGGGGEKGGKEGEERGSRGVEGGISMEGIMMGEFFLADILNATNATAAANATAGVNVTVGENVTAGVNVSAAADATKGAADATRIVNSREARKAGSQAAVLVAPPAPVGAADSTRGAADSTRGAADSTRGAADSTRGAADSTRGAADSTRGAADSTRGAADSTRGAADSARGAITREARKAVSLPTVAVAPPAHDAADVGTRKTPSSLVSGASRGDEKSDVRVGVSAAVTAVVESRNGYEKGR
ncbi:unnamed protein product [Closterium sp. Yama58-4]|nr:unnamed protein product [Closterium sp. Yama58-4]